MAKVIECINERACIGCGLCILTASKVLNGKFSLADSCIRVQKNTKGPYLFSVKIDKGICKDIEEVVNICPARCFALVEDGNIEE